MSLLRDYIDFSNLREVHSKKDFLAGTDYIESRIHSIMPIRKTGFLEYDTEPYKIESAYPPETPNDNYKIAERKIYTEDFPFYFMGLKPEQPLDAGRPVDNFYMYDQVIKNPTDLFVYQINQPQPAPAPFSSSVPVTPSLAPSLPIGGPAPAGTLPVKKTGKTNDSAFAKLMESLSLPLTAPPLPIGGSAVAAPKKSKVQGVSLEAKYEEQKEDERMKLLGENEDEKIKRKQLKMVQTQNAALEREKAIKEQQQKARKLKEELRLKSIQEREQKTKEMKQLKKEHRLKVAQEKKEKIAQEKREKRQLRKDLKKIEKAERVNKALAKKVTVVEPGYSLEMPPETPPQTPPSSSKKAVGRPKYTTEEQQQAKERKTNRRKQKQAEKKAQKMMSVAEAKHLMEIAKFEKQAAEEGGTPIAAILKPYAQIQVKPIKPPRIGKTVTQHIDNFDEQDLRNKAIQFFDKLNGKNGGFTDRQKETIMTNGKLTQEIKNKIRKTLKL